MKRYIAAVLINALLLQLAGCYSQKAITYKDFYNMPDSTAATILTNKNKQIKLTTDSLKNNYVKWIAYEDSITIWSSHFVRDKMTDKVVYDTIKLAASEINNVYIDEFDVTKTVFAIGIPVLVVIAVLAIAARSFRLSGPILTGSF